MLCMRACTYLKIMALFTIFTFYLFNYIIFLPETILVGLRALGDVTDHVVEAFLCLLVRCHRLN